jgi:hypothetical protein
MSSPGTAMTFLIPKGCRGQNIGLKGESIPVTTAKLKHRFHAFPLKIGASSQGTRLEHGVGHLRDHHSVHPAPRKVCILQIGRKISSLGRFEFTQNHEFAGPYSFL